jgi:hypothetical protein
MPSLLEMQQTMRRTLLDEADGAALPHVVAAGLDPAQRLNIYRNTILGTLTRALRLSYPTVQRLVGADFFEGAAQIFARSHAPHCADLNAYGGEFGEFLRGFEPAASIVYLADVARLEWAVNQALHAADVPALDVSRLAALASSDHDPVRFTPHPCVSLLRSPYPVDAIWRAVLQRDDAAMAVIDLEEGEVHLLVQRVGDGVEVQRLQESAWRFARILFDGHALGEAVAAIPNADAAEWLAWHLAEGRFIAFQVSAGARA